MCKILCSTGALIGKPNNRDYKLLETLSKQLTGEKVDESLRGKLQRIQQQEKKLKEDRNVLHQKKNRER